jgi:phosphinothricin acetyltransferase
VSAFVVRPAEERDGEAIRAIYNWAVEHTTATMETRPRTPAQQVEWFAHHDGFRYPALVAQDIDSGRVVGYGSLSPYIDRPGYRPCAETSVYVDPDWHGVGVGSTLLSALVNEAARRQLTTLLALITADNEASIRLHRRYGFWDVGTMRRVGFKNGAWCDVVVLQRFVDEAQNRDALQGTAS